MTDPTDEELAALEHHEFGLQTGEAAWWVRRLVAALQAARRERDEAEESERRVSSHEGERRRKYLAAEARAEVAEARLREVTIERDEWQRSHEAAAERECDLRERLRAVEAERDVWSGKACEEEQAAGNGPCGACRYCLPKINDALREQVTRLREALMVLADRGQYGSGRRFVYYDDVADFAGQRLAATAEGKK